MIFQFQSMTISILSQLFHLRSHITINSQGNKKQSSQLFSNNRKNIKPLSNEFYFIKQNMRSNNPKYQHLQRNRQKLPAFSSQDLVINLIKNHNIVLISGETG